MDFISSFALLIAPSRMDKWTRALTDTTFAGIHQLDWFDYLLLVPYFTLLTILAIYGAHRYAVVRGYLKYKHRIPQAPARLFDQLPPVTIQLPLFNEGAVAINLVRAVGELDYPRDRLVIQVLDDSDDDTPAIIAPEIARLREQGFDIAHLRREVRTVREALVLPGTVRIPQWVALALPPGFLPLPSMP